MEELDAVVHIGHEPLCQQCVKYDMVPPRKAEYNARLTDGNWAYVCRGHFLLDGVGLGSGKGHKIAK